MVTGSRSCSITGAGISGVESVALNLNVGFMLM
jgi:hypothetical protein